MVSPRPAPAPAPAPAHARTFLCSGVLEKLSLPSKNNTGLARPQKGGIPPRFPSVTQGICTELVLKGAQTLAGRRKAERSQNDPGSKGKNC